MLSDTYQKISRTPKKVLLRRLVRAIVNPWLVRCTSSPNYTPEQSIVLLGGPRSGTTWLAELLCTIPDTALMFEPLYLPKVKAARKAGVDWHTFLLPQEQWPQGEAFCRQILTGKVLNGWTTSFMPMQRAIRPRRWVIKLVRANMMLGWMLETFPFLRPALLIRHPCSTILSMRQQGWPQITYPPRLKKFEAAFPHVETLRSTWRHPVEYAAALWCMSYMAALLTAPRDRYALVSFERMVRKGEEEIRRLFAFLKCDLPPEALARLRRYSQMTKKDSPMYKGGDPLSKWRDALSAEEVRMILDVVKQFGMDFYTDEVEPDYARLYGPCPIAECVG